MTEKRELLERYLLTLGVDLDGAMANLHGWEVSIASRNDKEVAIVIVKGSEIHFVSLDERRAMSRKNTLEFMVPVIEKHGYATTRVPASETNHKLREKLGFALTWQDADFTYWACTELPFKKEEKNEPTA